MPKPVLQAMVLADHVYQDVSGKFIICGTFTRLWFIRHNAPPGAKASQTFETPSALIQAVAKAGSPHLYVALTGVRGEMELKLRYVDLSDIRTLFEIQFKLTSRDPVAAAEFAIPMPALPISKAGAYSLDLMHEDEILGSWRIAVTDDTPPSTEEGDT